MPAPDIVKSGLLVVPAVVFLATVLFLFRRQRRHLASHDVEARWNVIRLDNTWGLPKEGRLTLRDGELSYQAAKSTRPAWIHPVARIGVSRVRAGLEVTLGLPDEGDYTFVVSPADPGAALDERTFSQAKELVYRLREEGAHSLK